MTRVFFLTISFLLTFATAIFADETVIVCPACGREATPTAKFCSTCGEAIKNSSELETSAPKPSESVPKEESILVQAIREDLTRARQAKPTLAIHYYLNALALLTLDAEQTIPQEAIKKIANEKDACLAKVRRGKTPVPTSVAYANIASFRLAYNQAQTLARRVRCAQVWVPSALAENLTLEQKALLAHAIPPVCNTCNGAANIACQKCKGSKLMPCREPNCKDGQIVEPRSKKKRKHLKIGEEYSESNPCPKCNGTGLVTCTTCSGRGEIPCKRCNSTGITPPCRKCPSGVGIIDCPRCKGTGIYRDKPCLECKGEKRLLCPSCQGGGHLLR